MNENENRENISEIDLSKVKISSLLAQRFQAFGYKKIIGLILIIVISFSAGMATDRFAFSHKISKNSHRKLNMQRSMQDFNNYQSSSDGSSQSSQ